jgi:Lon protease-like protein
MDIETRGKQRFSIVELNHDRPFLQAEVNWYDDDEPAQPAAAETETAIELHGQFLEVLGQSAEVDRNNPPISFELASDLPVDLDFKQTILEMKSEAERIETLVEYYRAAIPKLEKNMRAREKASTNGHVR